MQILQQISLHGRIGTQGESEPALWTRPPSCVLDQAHAEGFQARERPSESSLFVGGATSTGNVIHLGLGFPFCEDRLLGAEVVVQR